MSRLNTKLGMLLLIVALACGSAFGADKLATCDEAVLKGKSKLRRVVDKATVWAITTGVTLAPIVALAKGNFSGSGGGPGVATFTNLADAQAAKDLLKKGQPLPVELVKRARVRTLDRWEMEKEGRTPPFAVSPNAQWPEIYQKAESNLRMISPIVARRLEHVAAKIEFGTWEGTESLPRLADAQPSHKYGPLDVPIQLAVRLSDGNSQFGDGPAQNDIRLKVIFNPILFAQLDAFDQAMLIFHEQFYALGQASGIKDSNKIRQHVRAFFAAHMDDVRVRTQGGLRMRDDSFVPPRKYLVELVQMEMIRDFGDYAMFFADLDSSTIDRNTSLADRHFWAFVEIVKVVRELTNDCVKALGKDQKSRCVGLVFDRISKYPNLPPEIAFAFISYFMLQRRDVLVNAEVLMDNRRSHAQILLALDYACEKLMGFSFLPEITAGHLAQAYCRKMSLPAARVEPGK